LNARRAGADLNDAIGKTLRYGIAMSAVTIGAGLALMLLHPPPGTPASLEAMLASGFGTPTLSPSALLAGVSGGRPVAVLELGTLILLATPIARVAASVLLFLRERDSMYAGITLLVLALLLLAILVVGPMEA
jgi:uncharacterized membrane protein